MEVSIGLRRLVVLSIVLILAGLALLLPSSALYSLLTSGSSSTSSASFELSRLSSVTSNTTTVESLLGFGLVGIGVIIEILSLFTDVGRIPTTGTVPMPATSAVPQQEVVKESKIPMTAADSSETRLTYEQALGVLMEDDSAEEGTK